jgi:5'-3' exonuclease
MYIYSNKKLLLIDFSYYYIHRYFALMSWFNISKTDYNEKLLLEKFEKLMIENVKKFAKKTKCELKNTILVSDCKRSTIWRLEQCIDYKANRELCQIKQPINPKIYSIIDDKIIPTLKSLDVQYIGFDKLEADDIISVIARNTSNEKVIITNDNDYLQLLDDKTTILNATFKDLSSRSLGCPKKDLLMKILVGDTSDNISSIVTKSTAKTLIEMTNDNLEEYLVKHNLIDKFNFNKNLIDMNNIPEEYKNLIKNSIQFI